jgi:hypothetical protein
VSGLSGVILVIGQSTLEFKQHDTGAIEGDPPIAIRQIPESFRVYGECAQDGDRIGSKL